jgi:S-DNA-T family DNA segregation ATPase FtsK/SpoIIIE
MKLLGPTTRPRLNEAMAVVFLFAGLFLALALASYSPLDPSWNTAAGTLKPANLTGYRGAHLADFLLQVFGLAAYAFPAGILLVGWKWIRSSPIEAPLFRIGGYLLLSWSLATAFGLAPEWRAIGGVIPAAGMVGVLSAQALEGELNATGAALFTFTVMVLSLYLISEFSVRQLARVMRVVRWIGAVLALPFRWMEPLMDRFWAWRAERTKAQRAAAAAKKAEARLARQAQRERAPEVLPGSFATSAPPLSEVRDAPPWEEDELPIVPAPEYAARDLRAPQPEPAADFEEIPIHTLEIPDEPAPRAVKQPKKPSVYELPPTTLMSEPDPRQGFDSVELKEVAARIKAKLEEFNVLGQVVQINPGPVVTTFEFKPDAGVKVARITALSEDLCLGLQAESVLIERIPGKPTVGIEVPNTRREVISLRELIESREFQEAPSRLSISLGKDISGRMKIASLENMPHLLIAGSTGSGKSVMLNTLIMSVLYKSTPDEVRLILVDPKRVELGIYEGIPHLLTPVITDPKKATNALRNAVIEMERRLKLLAAQGVRNIEQYNRKIRQMTSSPRSLFVDDGPPGLDEELRPLPFILIIIDELADLMMLERAGVEESVTRLAQMARAVGMHLVLATQRPSVDVITGLIKANFPSRISFRVATRVDSRTVLDTMGAEHLLGKGDMLFLPPGSARLTRVHGAYVSENEINEAVEFWKQQAEPDYDQTFLLAPPSEDDDFDAEEMDSSAEDPAYRDAVKVVIQMGKASTSILQRRLRLGYGRAARILDMMQKDGIIGPPDGSRPREVLKRPDWLTEVEVG